MALFNSIFKASTKKDSNYNLLNVDNYKEAISKKTVQLVDVRTPDEFRAGHISGAVNIDFFDRANFRSRFEKFDKEKPLYIYCRSGNRSQKAANIIKDLGFKEIYDLAGGIMRW